MNEISLLNIIPLPIALFGLDGKILNRNNHWKRVIKNDENYSLLNEQLLIQNNYANILKRVISGEINLRTKPIFCSLQNTESIFKLSGKYIVFNIFPFSENNIRYICCIIEDFADPLDSEKYVTGDLGKKTNSLEIFKMIESERKRIAQELHDEIIQKLLVTKLEVELLQKNNTEFNSAFDNIKNNILDTSKDIRALIQNLHPVILENEGLIRAVELLISKYNSENDFVVKLDIFGDYIDCNKSIELNIFRVIQESLLNVKKHSSAKNVIVQLHFNEDIIIGSVADDGKGFDHKEFFDYDGYGITSMTERVKALNGEFNIESNVNNGTKIIFHIPLLNKYHE